MSLQAKILIVQSVLDLSVGHKLSLSMLSIIIRHHFESTCMRIVKKVLRSSVYLGCLFSFFFVWKNATQMVG